MGAVQAQDYSAAKWAVAQRTGGLTSTDLDHALAEGSILRTHVLRPTWHFIVATDIRWVLRLTAPRVKALMAFGNRESRLDDATFTRSNRAISAALQGGCQLTRLELGDVLRRGGVSFPDTIGLGRLIMRAELDGVVCSGALRGKQHTYALLDERVPLADDMDRDAMLAALARRYFASHGPATVKDFAWWSGLSVTDGTAAVQLAKPGLEESVVDGGTYWSAQSARRRPHPKATTAHLLPNYDEYTVAYADRNPIRAADHIRRFDSRGDTIFNNVILVHGRVAGTWKRTVQKTAVHVAVTPFRSLTEDESAAVVAAAQRYGRFLELRAEVGMARSASR
jgi:Winged helix DNA-binding domain